MSLAQARTLEQLAAEARKAADALPRVPTDPALLKRISVLSVSGVKDHFRLSQGPAGDAWKPLLLRQGKPLQDTGRLVNTTVAAVQGATVVLSNNSTQAALQNFGGTVQAKSGKYLAIPVTPQARRAGSPRRMQGLSFRGHKGADSAVLVDRRGKVQFVLKTQVTVPRREFLGWSQTTLDRIGKLIGDHVEKAV